MKKKIEEIALLNPDIEPTQIDYSEAVSKVFDDILAKDTKSETGTDNMTCIIIRLKNEKVILK